MGLVSLESCEPLARVSTAQSRSCAGHDEPSAPATMERYFTTARLEHRHVGVCTHRVANPYVHPTLLCPTEDR